MNFRVARTRLEQGLVVVLAVLALRPTELEVLAALPLPPSTMIVLGLYGVGVLLHIGNMPRDPINIAGVSLLPIFSALLALDYYTDIWTETHDPGLFRSGAAQLLSFSAYWGAAVLLLSGRREMVRLFVRSFVIGAALLLGIALIQDPAQVGKWNEYNPGHFNYRWVPYGLDKTVFSIIAAVAGLLLPWVAKDRLGLWPTAAGQLAFFDFALLAGSRAGTGIVFIYLLFRIAALYRPAHVGKSGPPRNDSERLSALVVMLGVSISFYLIYTFYGTGMPGQIPDERAQMDVPYELVRSADSGRLKTMAESIRMIVEHRGLGAGMTMASLTGYYAGLNSVEHNQVLLYTNAYGIFFLFPFGAVILTALIKGARHGPLELLVPALATGASWMISPFMAFFAALIPVILCQVGDPGFPAERSGVQAQRLPGSRYRTSGNSTDFVAGGGLNGRG